MKKNTIKAIKIFFKTLSELFSFQKIRFIGTILFLIVSSLGGFLQLKCVDYITLTATDIYNGATIDIVFVLLTMGLFMLAIFITTIIGQYYFVYKIRFNTYNDVLLNQRIKKKRVFDS